MSEQFYKYSFRSPEMERCFDCPCCRYKGLPAAICTESSQIIDVNMVYAIPDWCRLEKEEVKEGEG
jgi:hypothetical protein